MPSRSNNIVMPVGHEDYTRMLSTGLPRHVTEAEYEVIGRYRPDLSTEQYPNTGYDFSGSVDGFGQTPSATPISAPVSPVGTDPISYIMGVLGPSGVGLIAIGAIVYFLFFRKGKE